MARKIDYQPQHEACEACGLWATCQSPHMRGSGEWNCPILFIGEAPGRTEDEPPAGVEPQPFIGKAGNILRDAIDVAEYQPHEYGFENVLRCRPPDNRTPKPKEIQHCSQFLVDAIEERNPYVVVPLGATALSAVLGESGITQYNGVVIERDGRVYIPAFHPSYFNYGNRDKLGVWFQAIETALYIARNGSKDHQPVSNEWTITIPRTRADIDEMLRALDRKDLGLVSYDIEAQWLSEAIPDNRVLSASFGLLDDKMAWSFPIDHDESWWTDDEIDYILDVMAVILCHQDIIGHNIRFDTKLTRALLGIDCKPAGCTMLVSQLIDAVPGRHGLKRLAGLHLGMYDYDKELEDCKAEHPECDYKKGGHYGNVPLRLLLPYGAKDAIATSELFPILEPKLTTKQRILYNQVIQPVDRGLGFMEQAGFLLDKYIADRYHRVYSLLVGEQREVIGEDQAVTEYTRMRQTGDIDGKTALRFSQLYAKAKKLPKFVEAMRGRLDDPDYDVGKTVQPRFVFNPNSSEHMAGVLYGIKGYQPVDFSKKTGCPSVGMKGLKLSDDIVEDDIFESYRLWKLYAGMVSKYLGPPARGEWDYGDDRVRVHFNLGGASTGRLSSSDPTNLQNIPTPEKEPGTVLAELPIKNIFKSTWYGQIVNPDGELISWNQVQGLIDSYEHIITGDTGCLYTADFSSMELRIMASVSGCQGMIDVFKEGLDPHCYVTRQVFRGQVPDDADDKTIKTVYKALRYRAKWTSWTLLFGGDEHTLHNMYRLPLDGARAIVKAYYERFPEILDYQKKTKAFLVKNGYVESPLGRRLYLPDVYDNDKGRVNKAKRTAVNMPIQGTASDILLMAIIIIGQRMRAMQMKSLMVNTVHDSVVLDVYPGELFALKELCEDSMENVVGYVPQYFPDVDLSWLRVPLKADGEVGTHYGALEEHRA